MDAIEAFAIPSMDVSSDAMGDWCTNDGTEFLIVGIREQSESAEVQLWRVSCWLTVLVPRVL